MANKIIIRRGKTILPPITTYSDTEGTPIPHIITKPPQIKMRTVTITIDGREYPALISDEHAKELVQQQQTRPRTGFERAKIGEKYHGLVIGYCTEENSNWDKNQYESGDYVTDEKLNDAREVSWNIHNMLAQWQALNDAPINWNVINHKGSLKWAIYCDYSAIEPLLCVRSTNFYRDAWVVYFSTKEKAQDALRIFHDQLTWYYTEYLPRLDAPPIINKPSWVDSTKAMSRKVVNKNDLEIRKEDDI